MQWLSVRTHTPPLEECLFIRSRFDHFTMGYTLGRADLFIDREGMEIDYVTHFCIPDKVVEDNLPEEIKKHMIYKDDKYLIQHDYFKDCIFIVNKDIDDFDAVDGVFENTITGARTEAMLPRFHFKEENRIK